MSVALGVPVAMATSAGSQMIRSHLFRSLPALLSAFVIASCSDSGVSGPSGTLGSVDNSSTDPSSVELRALWWKDRQSNLGQVSKTIDALGGTISIPETGFTMSFPAGAVAAPITITVTADADYVAYKMEPAGTQFLKDVTVTQSLANTEVGGQPLSSQLFAAYIADDAVSLSGKVPASEIEPSHTIFSSTSSTIPLAHVWIIRHFSRYMLASG